MKGFRATGTSKARIKNCRKIGKGGGASGSDKTVQWIDLGTITAVDNVAALLARLACSSPGS